MYYYLSIGTNIEPEANAVRISTALAKMFGNYALYPFIYNAPVSMKSQRVFLNSLAIISSDLNKEEVKAELNKIEIQLGRDRQDPQRSEKDRTADIDILTARLDYNEAFFLEFDAPYIPLVLAKDDKYDERAGADLSRYGLHLPLSTPQRPTTVYFDTRTRHIAVVDNRHRRLHDGLETALFI